MHFLRLLTPTVLYDKSDDGGSSSGGDETATMTPPPPSDKSTGGLAQAIPMNEGSEPPAGAPEGDKGGKPSDNGAATGMDEIRKSIKETSSKIPQKDRREDTIPYFEDEAEEGEGGADETTDETAEAKDSPEPDKSDQPTPEGEETDKYYDPEIHAEGKDVYPNAYNSRQDAEYGLAAKIERYDELASELEKVDSEVGSTVPAQIKEQIETYKDVTNLSDASDEEVRDLIVNMDMAIKSIDEKKKTATQRYQQQKKTTEVSEKYENAQKKASQASQELGLDRKINELPADATFEDVLDMADSLIEQKLEPIDNEISEMENNTSYAKEHGQQAWLNKIRELENKKADLQNNLKQDRQALIEFNDARLEKEKVESSKPVKLTDKQRYEKMDDVYSSWADDRSQGQFALDMFQAPTTDPVRHFRKFALAPANVNKYDLTTKSGWDKMHSHWKQTMESRFNSQQAQSQKQKQQKKKSSVDDDIPAPPINNGTGQPAKGTHGEIQKARDRIRKNSRQYFGNR